MKFTSFYFPSIRFMSWIGILLCILVSINSCKNNQSDGEQAEEKQPEEDHTILDVDTMDYNLGRTLWQKPDVVLEKMGNLQDKVVVDVGAGTGYFAFRLALKAKKVIAIDIDTFALNTITEYIPRLPEAYRERIETRLTKINNPGLQEEEADIAIIINTIAYIPELQAYLETLKKGLKKGGEIFIVDYKMKKLPINAPPKTERIYLDKMEEILEKSGFVNIVSDDTTLDFQYIIKATNP